MEAIKVYLERNISLSEEDWSFFSSKLVQRKLPKKASLLEIGQVEKYLSFIEVGIVRFFIPKLENDLTFGFCFENEFVSAYDSFLTQSPSIYQIETLTPITIWSLSYEDLQEIYAHTSIGNTVGRLAAENLYRIKAQRELSLLNETAEQRYLNLFNQRPELLKFIALKYLASYIGITPQALSRIRKRIS
ncbi:MAG: Crp/Fnr family transcriptional regulator [Aureispira sp.]|nr:Crp/Fnr family transcriptional regulator [Aureispira sp.]